jgi:PAS domain S-box-containing protein
MDKEVYIRAIEREKKARKEAERVLEEKALELYEANKKLNKLLDHQTEALNKTEVKYRNIFDTAFDAIVIVSEKGEILECNKKFLELTHYQKEEISNVSIANLVHPDDTAKSLEYIEKLETDGFYQDYRGRIITKNKNVIHIEVNSIALKENDKIVGSIDVVRDITDRIEVERMLHESGERFKALFNNTPLGIVINSSKGEYIDINQRLLNVLNYTKAEFITLKITDIVHKDDLSLIIGKIKEIRKKKSQLQSFEIRLINKYKDIKWAKITPTTIESIDGGSIQFISLIEDITEWKNSNNLLEQNEEKWRFVIENMELSLIEVDTKGKITKAYDRFCELTGYNREELIGVDPVKLLVKDDESLSTIKENMTIRKKGQNSAYELQIIKKNGDRAWLLISGAPLKDKQQKNIGSIGIHMDITPRKKMLNDLQEAKKIAEYSSKAKENFLANMSHEIRTPMNAIVGMTRLLKESDSDENKAKYLNAIESSADNLLVIINDILDISKIEANKLDLEYIPFSISKVMGDIEQLLYYKTEEKGILLKINVLDKMHDSLIGDPVRLSQILTNLISNAIKFTQEGEVACSIDIVKENRENISLLFTVSDTGIGISEDKLCNIFNSFTQEDQTTSRKFGGTGLGLTITKRLIELHHSSINVTSKKGEGTAFSFKLNYKKNWEETIEEKAQEKELNLVKIKGAKVLLVEDHEINKLLAETILTNWKMEVTHVYNGQEAVDLLIKNKFDIILMDIQMPVLDGLEATRIIRHDLKNNTPIIALTANAIKGDDIKCIDAGMNDYVSKPIEPSTLFNKIITHLNHGR